MINTTNSQLQTLEILKNIETIAQSSNTFTNMQQLLQNTENILFNQNWLSRFYNFSIDTSEMEAITAKLRSDIIKIQNIRTGSLGLIKQAIDSLPTWQKRLSSTEQRLSPEESELIKNLQIDVDTELIQQITEHINTNLKKKNFNATDLAELNSQITKLITSINNQAAKLQQTIEVLQNTNPSIAKLLSVRQSILEKHVGDISRNSSLINEGISFEKIYIGSISEQTVEANAKILNAAIQNQAICYDLNINLANAETLSPEELITKLLNNETFENPVIIDGDLDINIQIPGKLPNTLIINGDFRISNEMSNMHTSSDISRNWEWSNPKMPNILIMSGEMRCENTVITQPCPISVINCNERQSQLTTEILNNNKYNAEFSGIHEAGHAIMHYMQKSTGEVSKMEYEGVNAFCASIRPNTKQTVLDIMEELQTVLAGGAAISVFSNISENKGYRFFGMGSVADTTTDIAKAYNLADKLVDALDQHGLLPAFLKECNVSIPDNREVTTQNTDMRNHAINLIIYDVWNNMTEQMEKNVPALVKISGAMVEKGGLLKDEFNNIANSTHLVMHDITNLQIWQLFNKYSALIPQETLNNLFTLTNNKENNTTDAPCIFSTTTLLAPPEILNKIKDQFPSPSIVQNVMVISNPDITKQQIENILDSVLSEDDKSKVKLLPEETSIYGPPVLINALQHTLHCKADPEVPQLINTMLPKEKIQQEVYNFVKDVVAFSPPAHEKSAETYVMFGHAVVIGQSQYLDVLQKHFGGDRMDDNRWTSKDADATQVSDFLTRVMTIEAQYKKVQEAIASDFRNPTLRTEFNALSSAYNQIFSNNSAIAR